jgi:uncharacterized membrane protein YhaH (DUF805 family)
MFSMDTEAIPQLIQAVRDGAWYAVFGYAITLVIALWRIWQPSVWKRIPRRWQWAPALGLTGLTTFVAAWQLGVEPAHAVAVAVWAVLVGGPAAIGMAHTAKRLLEKKEEPPPDEPKLHITVTKVGLVFTVVILAGCAGSLEQARATRIASRDLGVEGAPADRGYCQSLDAEHRRWSAWARAGAIFTGADGVLILPAQELPPDYRGPAQYTATGLLVVGAVFTGYAQSRADGAAEAWAREGCGAP